MTRSTEADLATFEAHRAQLVAHAYRMLGDLGRAEDIVQEAWLRWEGRQVDVAAPRAYLVTLVTRLCINELESARAISIAAASAASRRSIACRWRSWSCSSV
jgi:DNA-directed RNA polymerase specialized sigma24 family protein